ncbi:7225_t:CDS:2 [Scutellospora calospora]|uniref:7225_t:CDS:1 n=1 Tax=Scutellospora calospora TaxID=85575 RepID=A0ACA9K760_9GLOM|nr:7225_t:CDS:2 [Scutellospora calospora]
MVVLKSLTNSQNITLEFLTEIANIKLVEEVVISFHGLSQDPLTKNYVMAYPYPSTNELDLSLKICNDADPAQRPSAGNLNGIVGSWNDEVRDKKNAPFYQQYQSLEQEYNLFSQNTPYQIHPTAITTSKPINTKQITQLLASKDLELNLDNLNIQEEPEQTSQIEIPPKNN